MGAAGRRCGDWKSGKAISSASERKSVQSGYVQQWEIEGFVLDDFLAEFQPLS